MIPVPLHGTVREIHDMWAEAIDQARSCLQQVKPQPKPDAALSLDIADEILVAAYAAEAARREEAQRLAKERFLRDPLSMDLSSADLP